MNITEASDFFKNLISKTANPIESKVYQKFIDLLLEIKNKDLKEKDIKLIEKKLAQLQLKILSEKGKSHFKNDYRKFKNSLISEFSLIPKNYYTTLGIGLEIALGTGLGLSFGIPFGMPMGMIYGMTAGSTIGIIGGLIFGKYKDTQAKKENRVLNIE